MEPKVSVKTMKAIRFHEYGGPEKLMGISKNSTKGNYVVKQTNNHRLHIITN